MAEIHCPLLIDEPDRNNSEQKNLNNIANIVRKILLEYCNLP